MKSARSTIRVARVSHSEVEPGIVVVVLTGRLDVRNVPHVEEEFRRITASGKPVIVDLSGVELMNSVGLAMLIEGANSMRACGASMVLLNPRQRVEKVIRIASLDQMLPILSELNEAVRRIKTAA